MNTTTVQEEFDPQNTISAELANKLVEASYPEERSFITRFLYRSWVVFGLAFFMVFAWLEPLSAMFGDWLIITKGVTPLLIGLLFMPLVMVLRAILLVESFGYLYHRFFQHVGFLTRVSQLFRKNQKYHWIHHMVIYPIGTVYRRARKYIGAEKGVAWSWVIPGIAVALLFLLHHGLNPASLAFVFAVGVYAQFVISDSHSRFHVVGHSWANSRYFKWLEDIHVLHHWDQRKNFTIIHPLMDILFGTYLSPANYPDELAIAYTEDGLTVSDLINWRYLLMEATPAERAVFISHVRYHTKSKNKLRLIMVVLAKRVFAHPKDRIAYQMFMRGADVFDQINSQSKEKKA